MIEPARAAFLLIDMQNGFIDGASPLCIAGAAATVPACAHALAAAREHGLAVFHVRRAYAADGSDVEAVRWEAWAEGGRPLSSADPMSLACPSELAPALGEPVVVKPSWSAFFGTDLDVLLRARGIAPSCSRAPPPPTACARRPTTGWRAASTSPSCGTPPPRAAPKHRRRIWRTWRPRASSLSTPTTSRPTGFCTSTTPRPRWPGPWPGSWRRRRGTRKRTRQRIRRPQMARGLPCPLPRRSSPSRPSLPAGSTSTTCTTRCPTGAPTPTRASPARGPSATRPPWGP